MESVGSLPGVASVAMADGIPLDRVGNFGSALPVDQANEEEGRVRAEFTRATEGYFSAIGVPLLQGRGFLRADDRTSVSVAVITQSLADRLWPGEDVLGRQFYWPATGENAVARTVVGVVGNVASSRASEDWPHVFFPVRQEYTPQLAIVVRALTDLPNLAAPFREAIRSLDPRLPVPRLIPGGSVVALATREQRANGRISGGLGLLVLVLSAMGVYGVVALAVTSRTREFGVRMAMGATRRAIMRRVLGDAVRLALPGLVVGGLLAVGMALLMRSMLLGLSPVDPVSFLSAGGLLLFVVVMAGFPPALRASAIQPVDALRTE